MNGEILKDTLKKLSLKPGDVVIFRAAKQIPNKDTMNAISTYIKKHGAITIFAEPGIDVEKFNEKQMEKMGWIRKDRYASSETE